MNRIGIVIAAAIALGLSIVNVVLGGYLILPLPVLQQRGAEVPYYLAWGMIWLTVGCAVVLGGFLISSLVRNPNRR